MTTFDVNEALESPVFVVGPLRSGTTLLRLLLDHHPEINNFGEFEESVSQGELNWWPEPDEFHKFLEVDRAFNAKKLSINKALGYEDLIKSFLKQLHDRSPKPIISASVHSRIELLIALWPKARFIHLLRDPRDVANSCIGMGWVGNVYEGADYWLEFEHRWDALKASLSVDQFCEVRYEELVSHPKQELGKICDFIGVEFSEHMLELEKDTTYSKPDSSYANQWMRRLSAKEIGWVEYKCSQLMEKRKYEIKSSSLKKPNLFELAYIKFQNRFYRLSFNVKRFGLLLSLMSIVSSRMPFKRWKRAVELRVNDINNLHVK